jgi:tRNA uridine 5-carboxymethylaminomethyl modification enzyme
MIDDLITRGTSEPYRMFTSRAEYRLLLREDNADMRLTPKGRELGLVDELRWEMFETKRGQIELGRQLLERHMVRPNSEEAVALEAQLPVALAREVTALDLVRRPELTLAKLVQACPGLSFPEDPQVLEQLEIQAKYDGYIARQQAEIERLERYDHWRFPEAIDYSKVVGLSNEVREKLRLQRPETVGQASRIPGVTPAAVSLLLVHLKKLGG